MMSSGEHTGPSGSVYLQGRLDGVKQSFSELKISGPAMLLLRSVLIYICQTRSGVFYLICVSTFNRPAESLVEAKCCQWPGPPLMTTNCSLAGPMRPLGEEGGILGWRDPQPFSCPKMDDSLQNYKFKSIR